MAGRTQQFIRNEYIQPPPSPPTLDAKKSPLALLAQTCSAIGKELSGGKMTSSVHVNSFTTQPEMTTTSRKSPPRSKLSPSASRASPNQQVRASPHADQAHHFAAHSVAASSVKREASPSSAIYSSPPIKKRRPASPPDVHRDRIGEEQSSSLVDVDAARRASEHKRKRSSAADGSKRRSTDGGDADRAQMSELKLPASSSYNQRSTATSMTSTRHASSHSVSPQQQPLFSMYDPYCVGCQGPHAPGAPCLDHIKSQMPFYPLASPAAAYPLYAHMVMAAAAARNTAAAAAAAATTAADATPHVCNWVNRGSVACGKRYGSADELLAHLRTHAVSGAASAASPAPPSNYLLSGLDKLSANPYAAYLSHQAAALAAVSPAGAGQLGGSMLTGAVRSASPLSRYNPYKSPGLFGPIASSLPVAAGVSPYCPPLSFYGQRLDTNFSYP